MHTHNHKREGKGGLTRNVPSKKKKLHPDPSPDVRPEIVRMTLAERRVAGLFRKWGLDWVFERAVFVQDPDGRPRIWTPDFFLPALRVYVEVVGNPDADYSFREEVFLENSQDVLFVHPHENNWIRTLIQDLEQIEADRRERFQAALGQIRNGASKTRKPCGRLKTTHLVSGEVFKRERKEV